MKEIKLFFNSLIEINMLLFQTQSILTLKPQTVKLNKVNLWMIQFYAISFRISL